MTWEIPDVNVADYDQHHAEAIDRLRRAPVFFVAVPVENSWDAETQTAQVMMMGGGAGFELFFTAIRTGLAGAVGDELESLVLDLQKWKRIDRLIRLGLVAAVGANLISLCFLWLTR